MLKFICSLQGGNYKMKKLVVTVAAAIASAGLWTSAVSAEEIVVQNGDNLWNLAREHQTTVNNLIKFNNLQSYTIHPGQVLQTEFVHTVVKGESLWAIAQHYGITVDELKESNHLTSDLILIGQVLTIPGVNADEVALSGANGQSTSQPARQIITGDEQAKENSNESAENPATELTEQPAAAEQPASEEPSEGEVPAPAQKQTEQQTTPAQPAEVSEEPATEEVTTQQEAQPGKTITVTSTGYTVESAGGSGITATGIDLNKNPNAKVISVDPKVIPLGSKVYVEGYGEAIAADTGGAIKGNKIDIYFPTREQAINWGVRNVNITIQE